MYTDKHGNNYSIRHGVRANYEVHTWIASPRTTTIMLETDSLERARAWVLSQATDKPEARSLNVRSQAPRVGARARVGTSGEAVYLGGAWWTGD
ncbi:MAG: hypothetical protein CL398_11650 [Acidiferrobacteraceae bacterium]|nr:hypothetical protein [Acidiferrobacteraceae bacterium]